MQKLRSAQLIPRPRAVRKLRFPGSRHAEHVRPLTTYGPAPPQALRAMEQSREALSVVLGRAITADGHVKGFRPDAIGFLAYLTAHDAHHHGQITMLARQLGYPVPQKVMFGMGEWNSPLTVG